MSHRIDAASLSRPGFWIGAVLVFGAILIVQLTVFADPDAMRRCIAMRRVWFNDSLRHTDLVLRDLEALKPAMLGDPRWQDYALRTLKSKKAWRNLAATALEMERKGVCDARWRWHGFRALLILGRDAKAAGEFRPRLSREDLAAQSPCAALLAEAMDEHAAGRTESALARLERALESSPAEPIETNLLRSLRMERLSELGRLDEAGEMRDLLLRESENPPRAALSQVPLLFSRGQAVEALIGLELFRMWTGGVEPWTDVHLNRCRERLSPPYSDWALETLAAWRRERAGQTPAIDKEFPALPRGETILHLRGEKDGLPFPFPSQSPLLFPMDIERPGTHTLVLRAGAERLEDRGAFAQVVIEGAAETYTILPSCERVDRRLSVYLPAGRLTLSVGVSPLMEETRKSRVRIEEIAVIRRESPPSLEEAGFRDFRIQPYRPARPEAGSP